MLFWKYSLCYIKPYLVVSTQKFPLSLCTWVVLSILQIFENINLTYPYFNTLQTNMYKLGYATK